LSIPASGETGLRTAIQSQYFDFAQADDARSKDLITINATTMSEEDKVADFQSLTGVPAPVAHSMLEAANWDIEVQSSKTRTYPMIDLNPNRQEFSSVLTCLERQRQNYFLRGRRVTMRAVYLVNRRNLRRKIMGRSAMVR